MRNKLNKRGNGRLFTLKVEAEGTGLKYKWQAQKPGESS